jgi:hypoxanthine phosphoribosyltransferase
MLIIRLNDNRTYYKRKPHALRLPVLIFRQNFARLTTPTVSLTLADALMLTINNQTFSPFITAEAIQTRIQELADQINQEYAEKKPLLVVVLNGAFLFAADLMKNLTIPCEITFIRVASYTATESTGQLKQILGLSESVANRDLIVIEDIVDTGLTICEVCEQLRTQGPASIAVATLLFKPAALKNPVDLRYVGFEIENRFVLGYGLDYDGLGRNTKDILVLA